MERLFDILVNCVSNPQYLSKANEILKDLENSKGYAPTLLIILNANTQKSVQTLAGILLKNLITDNWNSLCLEDQNCTKQGIISLLIISDSKLQNLIVRSI